MDEWKLAKLHKAQYRVVGNHSAVKICHWTKEAIRGHSPCYKQSFYGIKTANCLEMSPSITCNQRCLHCWRDTSIFSKEWQGPIDSPMEIIKGCIEERKKLLIGFRGHLQADQKVVENAMQAKQAAISLTGEPCMYPRLNELIDEFFNSGFESVYLVTSGTVPESLKTFNKLPSNLYLSLTASNPKMYKELCRPVIENAWEKVMQSVDLFSQIKTSRVIRLTLINGLNTRAPEEFIPLIEKTKAEFIECKAYMHLGYSRQRLTENHMPSMEKIQCIAKKIEENSNYKVKSERSDSRVVFLERKK